MLVYSIQFLLVTVYIQMTLYYFTEYKNLTIVYFLSSSLYGAIHFAFICIINSTLHCFIFV